jgi:hypothetical protein
MRGEFVEITKNSSKGLVVVASGQVVLPHSSVRLLLTMCRILESLCACCVMLMDWSHGCVPDREEMDGMKLCCGVVCLLLRLQTTNLIGSGPFFLLPSSFICLELLI